MLIETAPPARKRRKERRPGGRAWRRGLITESPRAGSLTAQIVALHKAGESGAAIARTLGCSDANVSQALRRWVREIPRQRPEPKHCPHCGFLGCKGGWTCPGGY